MTFAVLDPKGIIASKELALLVSASLLMLIVAIAVFGLAFFFAWRYRASNKRAVYMPNWEHGALSELVWWAIPIEIVLILGALTWTSTHELDPYKPLEGGAPLQVQVVALPWKWLFIYPEQGIGAVNTLYLPVGRPVEFTVTADAPMNAFWIPQLGGQIYAMTGMSTKLHLQADEVGAYEGGSSNYSGEGFASMKFIATAVSEGDFATWVNDVRQNTRSLGKEEYHLLAKPSTGDAPTTYSSVAQDLYDTILMKYMAPMHLRETHTH